MAVLLSVFSLMALVNELDYVGRGAYQLSDAALHVLLTMPGRLVVLAPATALLGSIIGLGELATGRELIAMLALGVSPARIGLSVLKAGALFMLGIMGLQEFVAPPAEQIAFKRRVQAISGTESLHTTQGFWSRDDRHFINVRSVLHGQIPSDVEIYRFDEQGRLQAFTWAELANTQDPQRWLLLNAEQGVIGGDRVVTRRFPSLPWNAFLTPEQVALLVLPVDTLAPSALYQYLDYLKATGQNAERFELAFWRQVSMPLSTAAMVLIGIPFVLGPLRQATAGKRVLHGALVGVAFYLASMIVNQLGASFEVQPALTTLGPAAVVCVAAVWLYRRIV